MAAGELWGRSKFSNESWNWVSSWFEEIHRHGKWNIYILTGSSFSTTSFHPSGFLLPCTTLVLLENDKLFSTNPQFLSPFQDYLEGWKIVSHFLYSGSVHSVPTLPVSVSGISETNSKSHIFRFILMHSFWCRKGSKSLSLCLSLFTVNLL